MIDSPSNPRNVQRDRLRAALEHTNLSPGATAEDIERTCREAVDLEVRAVVANPVWVRTAREQLKETGVAVVSVAGFPLGANRTEFKVVEAVRAAIDGAAEIDLVANIGWMRSGEFERSRDEIVEVRRGLPENVALKVIIEATLLAPEELERAVEMCVTAEAQFVKTSTGYRGGATEEMIATLCRLADGRIEVKASGGIKTAEQSLRLLDAGASRIGSSSCVDILH